MLGRLLALLALLAARAGATPEVQSVALTLNHAPDPPSGTFRLLWGSYPSAYLAWNSSSLELREGLAAVHADLEIAHVSRRSGADGFEWRVTFEGDSDVDELVPNALLTDADLSVSTLQDGEPNSECYDFVQDCVDASVEAACADVLYAPSLACCGAYASAVSCMAWANCSATALAEPIVECARLGCADCGTIGHEHAASGAGNVTMTIEWALDGFSEVALVDLSLDDEALPFGPGEVFPNYLNSSVTWTVAFRANETAALRLRIIQDDEVSYTLVQMHAEMRREFSPSLSVSLVEEADQDVPILASTAFNVTGARAFTVALTLGRAPHASGAACDSPDAYDPDCDSSWCGAALVCDARPDGLDSDGSACAEAGSYAPSCASSWCGAEAVCGDGALAEAPRLPNGHNCSEPFGYDATCASSWCALDGTCAHSDRLADGEPCFGSYEYDSTCVGSWCSAFQRCTARDGRDPDYAPCDEPGKRDTDCASLRCNVLGYCWEY